MRAADDNVISAQERQALSYQARQNGALPDEQAFLENEVRVSGKPADTTFEPGALSFPARPPQADTPSPAARAAQERIESYGPERPLTPTDFADIRGDLRSLYESGETDRAMALSNQLKDKASTSTATYAQRVIQTHTDITRDGIVTDDEFAYLQEQVQNLRLFADFYQEEGVLTPETRQLFEQAHGVIRNFDRSRFGTEAPAPPAPGPDTEAARDTWDVTADVRVENTRMPGGAEREEISWGAAASVDRGDWRFTGAVDVTQTRLSDDWPTLPQLGFGTTPTPGGLPGLPRERPEGTLVSGALSVSDARENQRFTVEGRSDGRYAARYERGIDVGDRRLVAEVEASGNRDRDEFRVMGTVRVPLQGGPIG